MKRVASMTTEINYIICYTLIVNIDKIDHHINKLYEVNN